jgi:phosphoribosylformimino-5-aminoimidazole carboxamide ribotide isomerase
MIIFPAIDLRGGRCVRLERGCPERELVFSDDPVAVARRWAEEGAEWLHVIDLDAALGIPSRNLEVLKRIIEAVPVQVQFGGGLRDMRSIKKVLGLGAARVILGTSAVENPSLVREAIEKFGAERVLVSIDAKGGRVAVRGWQEVSSLRALDLALRMRGLGLKRAVYTDVARDGMLAGVNAQAVAEMARRSGLLVIASGGVSSLDDIRLLKEVEHCGIEGVIVGRALYSGALSLSEAMAIAQR